MLSSQKIQILQALEQTDYVNRKSFGDEMLNLETDDDGIVKNSWMGVPLLKQAEVKVLEWNCITRFIITRKLQFA